MLATPLARRVSAVASIACCAAVASAQNYQLVGSYPAPSGAFDILPDGRLIAIDGDSVSVQSALHTPTFGAIGSVTPGHINASFGASFIAVNPSGTTFAIGDNDAGSGPQDVLLIDVAALSITSPTAPTVIASTNNSAAWSDDSTLFVSGAANFVDPSTLTRIDALTESATVVVDDLNGASAGVAVFGGRVYTGNGFAFGTGYEATGAIASFALGTLHSATLPVPFDSGELVATALSAASLDFDGAGNMIVGGSNAFGGGEGGFVSVIPSGAFPDATSADGQRLFPDTGTFGFPSARFNDATGEILVSDGGTIYRFAVPSPGGAMLIACLLVGRRRRA